MLIGQSLDEEAKTFLRTSLLSQLCTVLFFLHTDNILPKNCSFVFLSGVETLFFVKCLPSFNKCICLCQPNPGLGFVFILLLQGLFFVLVSPQFVFHIRFGYGALNFLYSQMSSFSLSFSAVCVVRRKTFLTIQYQNVVFSSDTSFRFNYLIEMV